MTNDIENIKVAVCGTLPSACRFLGKKGIYQIDRYNDAADIAMNLNFKNFEYDLILVYAPFGDGLIFSTYNYTKDNETVSVPLRMIDDLVYSSTECELNVLIDRIAKNKCTIS